MEPNQINHNKKENILIEDGITGRRRVPPGKNRKITLILLRNTINCSARNSKEQKVKELFELSTQPTKLLK
jgi:hypothetical protein